MRPACLRVVQGFDGLLVLQRDAELDLLAIGELGNGREGGFSAVLTPPHTNQEGQRIEVRRQTL